MNTNRQFYEIRSGIAPPPRKKVARIGFTERLRALNVGDSFTFPPERRHTIATTAWHLGKKLGRKFEVRALSEEELGVWRVS